MKIYDLKTFLVSVFIGGGFMIWNIIDFVNEKSFFKVYWILLFAYLTWKGIYVSVSEKAHQEYKQKLNDKKIINKKIYGEIGKIMNFVYYAIFILSGLVAFLFPEQHKVFLTLFYTGAVLIIISHILYIYYKKTINNDI